MGAAPGAEGFDWPQIDIMLTKSTTTEPVLNTRRRPVIIIGSRLNTKPLAFTTCSGLDDSLSCLDWKRRPGKHTRSRERGRVAKQTVVSGSRHNISPPVSLQSKQHVTEDYNKGPTSVKRDSARVE